MAQLVSNNMFPRKKNLKGDNREIYPEPPNGREEIKGRHLLLCLNFTVVRTLSIRSTTLRDFFFRIHSV